MKTWYAGVFAGGHQGSVADEETGRTVALTYDPADAPLIAEAPAMLEALRAILEWADPYALPDCDRNERDVENARAILQRLEGLK